MIEVTGTGDALGAAGDQALRDLLAEAVPDRLAKQDATLWGPDAEGEASVRLGWLTLPETSRELLPRLAELAGRYRAAGLDHVVLAGMGGSSLAPEVITRTAGVPLTVLDTTDPHQVRRALADRLDRTVVVVASKSGGTVETDSHRRLYEEAFRAAGLSDAEIAQRFVVVTDPGSPLAEAAAAAGYEVVLADPSVGGRYAALSAFGLVPSALAGADVTELLDAAAEEAAVLARSEDNAPLVLGAALGGNARAGRDKLVLADAGSGLVGFGDWAEQLVAESTGKQGRGILPVVVAALTAPGFADGGPDAHRVALGARPGDLDATVVSGPLGAQFLAWEYATAVAGVTLGINPFDQPNVQESKDNTNELLARAGDGALPEGEPLFVDADVAVYGDTDQLGAASTVAEALGAFLGTVDAGGYLAILAFLDRIGDAAAAHLQPVLASRLGGRQATFGWGPRYLHSTGQYHKGGPQNGSFLQVTGAVTADLPVPGKPYSLGRLQLAQALGDLNALAARGRPTLRLHLRDRETGLRQLLAAAEALP